MAPTKTPNDPATWDPCAPSKIVISCTSKERAQVLAAMEMAGKKNISAFMIANATGEILEERITASVKRTCEEVLEPHRCASRGILSQILEELKSLRSEIENLKK